MNHPLSDRRAGVVCHLTSIPERSSGHFIEFMAAAGLSVWQVLPLNPPDRYRSPYNSTSLFALDATIAELIDGDVPGDQDGIAEFRTQNHYWLDDYTLFEIARARFGQQWANWPAAVRDRSAAGLAELRSDRQAQETLVRQQFHANRSWLQLREQANRRGILIFGDMPLYPAYESADVWSRPELFALDEHHQAEFLAGVPPDYYSATGQLWGNPVYNWAQSKADGYAWWISRLQRLLSLFDVVRIDHFRGLQSFWAVPAGAADARSGEWRPGPDGDLLSALRNALGNPPLVAEDLGIIDSPVEALRDAFELPGMKVLQFAFDGDQHNPHLPAAYPRNAVAYTGTHDNDTSEGWYASLDAESRARVDHTIGTDGNAAWRMIRTVFASKAATAIAPLQDYLGLGASHRMNTPGTRDGNWAWQFNWNDLTPSVANRIRTLVQDSGRSPGT